MDNSQNIVLIRDHSASMRKLALPAMNDYNTLINDIKQSAIRSGIKTKLTVINLGISTNERIYNPFKGTKSPLGNVSTEFIGKDINSVYQMGSYQTTGLNTPLLDSIGTAIMAMEELNEPNTPVLVMGITDGGENASVKWSPTQIATLIEKKQKTGMWTFAFCCPRGYSNYLRSIGIDYDNILEWDQTDRGMEESGLTTRDSMRDFYEIRSSGGTSTDKFFVDPANIRVKDIKEANMKDVTDSVEFYNVHSVTEIRPFVEQLGLGYNYVTGQWYYELSKPETLQATKKIIIRNKNTRKVYAGEEARNLLQIPYGVEVKIYPKGIQSTNYQIFVQSLSVNRKLMPKTSVCHFPRTS